MDETLRNIIITSNFRKYITIYNISISRATQCCVGRTIERIALKYVIFTHISITICLCEFIEYYCKEIITIFRLLVNTYIVTHIIVVLYFYYKRLGS